LASSSGASTSSSRQNGAGLSWKIANTSAIAVSAFSPPDSRWMVLFFLPGRLGHHLHAGVQDLVAGHHQRALPPPNSWGTCGRSAR
jgi:hypothetical protein